MRPALWQRAHTIPPIQYVEEGQMASVLPNMQNFPASHMIGKRTMFKDEQ